MVDQLIVNFPTHQNRFRRSVQFSEMTEIHIVDRHENNENVDRHDLWYNKSDYSRMRLALKNSIFKVRALTSAGIPVSYSASGAGDVCLVGIEHLLSSATVLDVRTCRRRCTHAVLQEQARQAMNASDTSCCGWNNIAIASLVETRRTAFRARQLGKLHHESI